MSVRQRQNEKAWATRPISRFDHKIAVVRLGDEKTGKWGYIDHTGKYFVNPQFDDAYAFTDDGLARVRIAGKWGYIRR
jgi:hypothetical protein